MYFDVTWIEDRVCTLLTVRTHDLTGKSKQPGSLFDAPRCHTKIVAALLLSNRKAYDDINSITPLCTEELDHWLGKESAIGPKLFALLEELCGTINDVTVPAHTGASYSIAVFDKSITVTPTKPEGGVFDEYVKSWKQFSQKHP